MEEKAPMNSPEGAHHREPLQPQPEQRGGIQYANRVAMGLAIAQMVLGAICLINGIILFAVPLFPAVLSGYLEVWTPLFFIVAGFVGIFASLRPGTGLIVFHMILSILASVASFVLFVDACVWVWPNVPHAPLVVFGFIEFVVSITSSAFCCKAVCCGRRKQPTTVVVSSGQAVAYQQVPQRVVVHTEGEKPLTSGDTKVEVEPSAPPSEDAEP